MSSVSLGLDTAQLGCRHDEVSLERQFEAGKILVERLALRPGERVLDVGSGGGLLAEYLAGIVRPSGVVVVIEPLPMQIGLAKRRTNANRSFRVRDAYEPGRYADASFDVVYLNAAFPWQPADDQRLAGAASGEPEARRAWASAARSTRSTFPLQIFWISSREKPSARSRAVIFG
jgi:arsenite methyltransferase